jgi:hypothetical protein
MTGLCAKLLLSAAAYGAGGGRGPGSSNPVYRRPIERTSGIQAAARYAIQVEAATKTHWENSVTPELKAHLKDSGVGRYEALFLMVQTDVPSLGTAEAIQERQFHHWRTRLPWRDDEPTLESEVLNSEEVMNAQTAYSPAYRSLYSLVWVHTDNARHLESIIRGNSKILWAGSLAQRETANKLLRSHSGS